MRFVAGAILGVFALANIVLASVADVRREPGFVGPNGCQVRFCVACVPGDLTRCSRCVFGKDLVDGLCVDQLPQTCNVQYCREDKCNNNKCDECHHGFYVAQGNSACVSCKSTFGHACESCTASKCTHCAGNTHWDEQKKQCVEPPKNCNHIQHCNDCDTVTGTCKGCTTGHFLQHGHCESCRHHFGNECQACTATKCTSCAGNTVWDESAKKCVAPPKTCDANCDACDTKTGVCSSCKKGWYLQNNACNSCNVYGSDCAACTASKCTDCENGTEWNPSENKCVEPAKTCDANCDACDTKTGVCSSCKKGWFLQGNACNSCNVYGNDCAACTASKCTDCENGTEWSEDDKKCKAPVVKPCADPNCVTCEDGHCKACAKGFYRQGDECKRCMDNCLSCTSFNTCDQCAPRHYWDKTQKKCLPFGENCAECECKPLLGGCAPLVSNCKKCVSDDYRPQSDGKCTACAANEYRDGNSCKKCADAIPNCNACTNVLGQVLCTSCSQGIVPLCTLECEKCPEEHWRSGPIPCTDLDNCKPWKVCEASKLQFEILPGTAWTDRQCLDVGKMLTDLANQVVGEVKDIVKQAEQCIKGGSRPCGCLQTATNDLGAMVADYEKKLADLNKALDLASSIEEIREIQKAIDLVITGMTYAEKALATISNIFGILTQHKVC